MPSITILSDGEQFVMVDATIFSSRRCIASLLSLYHHAQLSWVGEDSPPHRCVLPSLQRFQWHTFDANDLCVFKDFSIQEVTQVDIEDGVKAALVEPLVES